MKIGVLKERKTDERRVALSPDHARHLLAKGHEVLIEKNAGSSSGFEDSDYKGCCLVNRESIYANCRLLLKVKCPLPEEYVYFNEQHILFTYLHFDENIAPGDITRLVATGLTAIAYEWVEANGRYPLLQPMSELTGKLCAYKSMELLMEEAGILPGALKTARGINALVIGAGKIGCNAIEVFYLNGFKLTIVDKNPSSLYERLSVYTGSAVAKFILRTSDIIPFDEKHHQPCIDRIRQTLPKQHIVINTAVRRPSFPKNVCAYLIDKTAVSSMRPKSILCDATACDADFIETALSSESLAHFYLIDDVIHYNCDHIPSLVPQTATFMLTNATFPYVAKLSKGFEKAIIHNESLYNAVMCYDGHVTHRYSAVKKNLPYTPLDTLFNRADHVSREQDEQLAV